MARDDKRERLLAAAAAVFAERDFHRVQVSDVAERAGVGKGTVYLYFPTKDHLHRAALEASLDGIRTEVQTAVDAAAPAEETLRRIVLAPALLLAAPTPAHGRPALRARQRTPRRGPSGRTPAVGRARRHRLGVTRSERHLAAALLLGMVRAAILEHAVADRPEAVARRLVDTFLHGIGGRARVSHRGAA
jgi:AcrR family transcriptional regulator